MSELLFSIQQKWIEIYTLIYTWQESTITVVHVTILQVFWSHMIDLCEEQTEIYKKKIFPSAIALKFHYASRQV